MTSLPPSSRYVVIGAGIHGLSTAWHLARELQARGLGRGEDVLVLDKSGVGAGASGIACGVIRNNYFQPAMRELMAHSVSVWESDPEAFAFHPVGYMQIAPEAMNADVAKIYAEQQAIGYPSTLIEGERDCRAYMLDMFDDWQAPGITAVLHEQRADTPTTSARCAAWPPRPRPRGCGSPPASASPGWRSAGERSPRCRPTRARSPAISWSSPSARGSVTCGPCSTCPDQIPVTGPDGTAYQRPMWTYWALQEGTLAVDPSEFTDNGVVVPAGTARRLEHPLVRRCGRGFDHRPDVGDLLQARLLLRRGPGRRLAARGGQARRAGRRGPVRAGEPGVHGARGFCTDVDLRARALPQAVRGPA